jgi:hypothetical protein
LLVFKLFPVSTLIEKISRVLTNGLLSSKEVEAGYGKDSGDDNNSTLNISLHPLVSVNVVRFLKGTSVQQKMCS